MDGLFLEICQAGLLCCDLNGCFQVFRIVGQYLTPNTVLERRDDGTSVGVIFRVGREDKLRRSSGSRNLKPRIWISPSSRILNKATCIRGCRSGSSLITKCTDGPWAPCQSEWSVRRHNSDPDWRLSKDPHRRSASATLTSGVASFSMNRSERCIQPTGVDGPSSSIRSRA